MSELDWYVVQTKPHQEDSVEKRLSAYEVAVFLPRIAERVRAGAHLQRRIAAMFPGYLFVQLDVAERAKSVRYTPGVRDFLRCSGEPQPVSAEAIASLRERCGSSGVYERPSCSPRPGARLRIEEGPLRGFEVIFERELSGLERVAVLLAEVNLSARIVLSGHALAAA